MKRFTTIVFDLDGTLLNTLTDLHRSVNHALSEFGFPDRTIDEVRRYLGNGYHFLIEHCLPEGSEKKDIDKVLAVFEEYYYKNSMNSTCPYEGIIETLNKLKNEGYKTAIVSNKGMKAVKELAKHFFDNTIDVAIGECESIRRKPAPDAALEALKIIGSSNSESLYIGDSEVDIETAKNAGMQCLSVSWGFREKEYLAKCGAKDIIDQPSQILDYLENI